jgi:hypothetical protein
MISVFVPVVTIPTQLTRIKTDVRFVAEDPWNGNRTCAFTLNSYMAAGALTGCKP